MSVKIGHARGGDPTYTPGDQTGAEVRTQAWYNAGWNFVARAKDPAMREKMAKTCEAVCANNETGYSQTRRNDIRAAAVRVNWDVSKIRKPADCDCSSLMSFCAEAAGAGIERPGGNYPWTGNMLEIFRKSGAFDILTDAKYLTSDKYLLRGDVLVNEATHTAMALSNGELAITAAEPSVSGSGAERTNSGAQAHFPQAENASRGACEDAYTVIPGDTLWGIAVRYKTTVPAICAANGLNPDKFIYPGQKIKIPT